jgi:HEAT repeat protein
MLKESHPAEQARAALCLAEIGTAREVGPALVAALGEAYEEDTEVHLPRVLLESLHRVGPAVSGAVATLLRDPRPEVRRTALGLLAHFSDMGKDALPRLLEAVPAMLEAVLDPDPGVAAGARAILVLMQRQRDILSTLRRGLKAKEADVRVRAAGALGEMKGEAGEAVADLLPLARDKDEAVRSAALAALAKIDPEAVARARMR